MTVDDESMIQLVRVVFRTNVGKQVGVIMRDYETSRIVWQYYSTRLHVTTCDSPPKHESHL